MLVEYRESRIEMRTIAVLNQKGGVGKTTTVVNTAAALASMGNKVIAIDLDPQAHLTIHLGIEPQSIESGSYGVLIRQAKFEQEILLVRPNLWLLPANINLVGAESELVNEVGRETILREAVSTMANEFDYVLIDCPPSLSLLTLNALATAGEILIPLQPHFLALQGLGKLLQTVDLVNRRINPSLKVTGILLCMFDSRTSLSGEVKDDIERFLDNARGSNSAWAQARVLPTFIRRNIKLAEAPSYGKTIFEYEQNCHGAQDYHKVAQYLQDMDSAPQSRDSIEPFSNATNQYTVIEAEPNNPPIEIMEIPQLDSHPSPQLDVTAPYNSEDNEIN
jgi:chromosome partitioning protein